MSKIKLSDHFTYKRLLRFVFPTIIMMMFTSIYGVVDGFFVSNFVGKTPFAALNLVMPFVMIIGGMGFMIGTAPLVSFNYGAGNHTEMKNLLKKSIILNSITGITLTALAISLSSPHTRTAIFFARVFANFGTRYNFAVFAYLNIQFYIPHSI